MRVKIVEPGWEGYTGNFGVAVFENGVAELSELEANRVGAAVRIVELNEDDEEDGVVNVGHEITKTKDMSAPVEERVEVSDEPAPETEKVEEREVHTREQLEEIADAEGIKGLRVIANPLGIKSTKMSELIDKIMEAENAV